MFNIYEIIRKEKNWLLDHNANNSASFLQKTHSNYET